MKKTPWKTKERIVSVYPLLAKSPSASRDGSDRRKVLTQDISATGAYFVANATPETGDPVAVNLYWQPEGEPDVTFKTVGTVTRVDHLPDNTWGFAVTFEDPEWQQLDQPPGQE